MKLWYCWSNTFMISKEVGKISKFLLDVSIKYCIIHKIFWHKYFKPLNLMQLRRENRFAHSLLGTCIFSSILLTRMRSKYYKGRFTSPLFLFKEICSVSDMKRIFYWVSLKRNKNYGHNYEFAGQWWAHLLCVSRWCVTKDKNI